jgi:hypothetical protein
MELTQETFDDFIARLKHHNHGAGVNDHFTANPIFIVQKKERICGLDSDYASDYVWINASNDHEEADERTAKRLDAIDDAGRTTGNWDKVYYIVQWSYVCAHLTREAALAFIKRKQHDYKELRVYVDSQYHCWEYNTIIKGLLDGNIILKGGE